MEKRQTFKYKNEHNGDNTKCSLQKFSFLIKITRIIVEGGRKTNSVERKIKTCPGTFNTSTRTGNPTRCHVHYIHFPEIPQNLAVTV